MKTICITTGDRDGVGLEVAVKALQKIRPRRGERVIVFRSKGRSEDRLMASLKNVWSPKKIHEVPETARELDFEQPLIDLALTSNEVDWFETAVHWCLQDPSSGIATGPLSKTLIQQSGRKDIGHTDILERLSRCSPLYQAYLGRKFHVVLATAHVPIARIQEALTPLVLEGAIDAALSLRSRLAPARRILPIGLLGLNPHAGEGGLIGRDEMAWSTLLRRYQNQVFGPLSPDAAFRTESWDRFSVYVACYHDQGLIPFKMVHGSGSGAQLTMGLPFVRTSVDHGTAKDIRGKKRADPGSMVDAINWCRRLITSP